MTGGDRAGMLQMSDAVDAKIITCTMGNTTGPAPKGWYKFVVISTEVQLAGITAPAMAGSSLITSATTWVRGQEFACGSITGINVSVKSSKGKVLAYRRILI